MKRLSIFHSRLGAAALAAALHYSFGPAGQAELLSGLRHLPASIKQPRAFVRSGEAMLVIADAKRQLVLQTAISNVVGLFHSDLEIVFYRFNEVDCKFAAVWLWLLARGLLPDRFAKSLAQRIWDGVSR